MKRLQSACDIKDECVKVVDKERFQFVVKSQDTNCSNMWYKVSFGNETNQKMPSCECIDWERNRLPCKHFLAIFSNYPDCGFDRLSLVYKDLPFLNLDEDVIFRGNNVASLEMEEEMELSTMSATNKSVSRLQSSPKQDSISINWSAKCKEGVKQITSLLHVVDDNDILKEAHSLVTSCIELLNRHLCSS
jgi:hypothetical protein